MVFVFFWSTSLSMTVSRSIYVAADGIISFFFLMTNTPLYIKYVNFLDFPKLIQMCSFCQKIPLFCITNTYILHLKKHFPHLPVSPLTSTLLPFLQVFVGTLCLLGPLARLIPSVINRHAWHSSFLMLITHVTPVLAFPSWIAGYVGYRACPCPLPSHPPHIAW